MPIRSSAVRLMSNGTCCFLTSQITSVERIVFEKMSRLIVKNLPKHATEEDLRRLFSQKGTITDLKLKYTLDGKFRHFAFVGYKSEEEAEEAAKYFDNACLKTSRLKVEICERLGSASKLKAVNQNATSEVESVEAKVEKKKIREKVNLLEKYAGSAAFQEFLTVHNMPNVNASNKIEDGEEREGNTDNEEETGENDEASNAGKLADSKISDNEYKKNLIKNKEEKIVAPSEKKEETKERKYQLFTVKLKGLPYSTKKKDVKTFFSPLVPFTIRLPPKIKGIAYAGFKEEKMMNKALLKDRSFLNGRRIFVVKSTNSESGETNNQDKCLKWKKQEELLEKEESVAESGKIFVRNLSYTVTENDIEQLFVKYGPLATINFPIDHFTKKPKGFATVTFVMPENAAQAFSELDGTIFQGRVLHLLPGKANDEENSTSSTQNDSNYKNKKQAQNKKQAGSSHNWNSLFLGHDAVASVVADTYGVSKEDVLGPHADGSAAVRLAMGETQIVAETRKFLEEQGVVLDAFTTPSCERSKTVILVKGLPSKTEVAEIREVFEKFGFINRIILPPSGITAIVEFMEPSEAKEAFNKLAYKKFKNTPLFLEWAPKDSLQASKIKNDEKPKAPPQEQKVEEQVEQEEQPEKDTTIFVKNLNFETTDESLRKHFETCGKLKYATVSRKINKNDPQHPLSMGYGFVQYIYKKSADAALKNLQQSQLDGKSLELKRSDRDNAKTQVETTRKVSKLTKQTGTKILVRNVPFQATKQELFELFKAFGEIKALRMPKKLSLDSSYSNRGFAFVDYKTENDAKAAFDALCQSTHLYGRRLVLEWATTEENVEQLRKRTADHFTAEETISSKKSVFSLE